MERDFLRFLGESLSDPTEMHIFYWGALSLIGFLLLASIFYPLLNDFFSKKDESRKRGESRFYGLAFLILIPIAILAGRWPCLFILSEFMVDESFFLAGAAKLTVDPVFWRSVDGATGGPLNFYVLLPAALLGFKIDYASARVISFILVIVSVIFLYLSFVQLYNYSIARLAVLPVVITYALVTHPDFVHYSSEHLSIALISIELWLFCKCLVGSLERHNWIPIFFLGFVAGLTPFAKLQSVPISGAIIAIFAFHSLLFQYRNLLPLLKKLLCLTLGCLTFPAIVLFFLFLTSTYHDFLIPYVKENIHYASRFGKSNLESLRDFLSGWVWHYDLNHFLKNAILTFVLISMFILFAKLLGSLGKIASEGWQTLSIQQLKYEKSLAFLLCIYATLVAGAAIFSVIRPGGPFPHYSLYLIIPTGFLLGSILGAVYQTTFCSKTLAELKFLSFSINFCFLLVNAFFIVVNRLWIFPKTLSPDSGVLSKMWSITPFPLGLDFFIPAVVVFVSIASFMEHFAVKYPSKRFLLKCIFLGITTVFLSLNIAKAMPTERLIRHPYIDLIPELKNGYKSEVSEAILKHAKPGESMVVWGWMPRFYVETGLIMATREPDFSRHIQPGPHQAYHIQRFLADLRNSNASIFVDAVAPGMFAFTERSIHSFERFPEIAAVVLDNFELVDEVEGVRIYRYR